MKKEIVYTINLDAERDIVQQAVNLSLPIYQIEGGLMDNWLIETEGRLPINGESRRYIIIQERYRNTNASDLIMMLTDNVNKADELYEAWIAQAQAQQEEYENEVL